MALCPVCYRKWGCDMPDQPLSVCPVHLTEENLTRMRMGDWDWPQVFEALQRHGVEVSSRAAALHRLLSVRIRLLRSANPIITAKT